MKTGRRKKKYVCENCKKTYSSYSSYQSHITGCVKSIYHKCKIFRFKCSNIEVFDGHMDMHVKGNRWICLSVKMNLGFIPR